MPGAGRPPGPTALCLGTTQSPLTLWASPWASAKTSPVKLFYARRNWECLVSLSRSFRSVSAVGDSCAPRTQSPVANPANGRQGGSARHTQGPGHGGLWAGVPESVHLVPIPRAFLCSRRHTAEESPHGRPRSRNRAHSAPQAPNSKNTAISSVETFAFWAIDRKWPQRAECSWLAREHQGFLLPFEGSRK